MVSLDDQIAEIQEQILANQKLIRMVEDSDESSEKTELIEVNQKLINMLDTLYSAKQKEKDCEVKDLEVKESKGKKVLKVVLDVLKVVVPLCSTALIMNYDRTGHIIPWKMIDYSDKKLR